MPSTFLGLVGTDNFAPDERPKSWREGILYEYPNGDAPITAITNFLSSESADDYEFNWWTKDLPEETAVVTGIYSDADLGSAYTTAAKNSGSVLYLKMAEADADKFRVGLVVHFVDKENPSTAKGFGKSIQVVKAGANSFVAVQLIASIASSGAVAIDYARIIGTINPQGGLRPQAQSEIPVKYTNFTQIFRDPLSITRTAQQTKVRTKDKYAELRREALQYHSIRMEQAFISGVKYEGIGDNGKPETATGGILQFIQEHAPANVSNYVTADHGDTKYANPGSWNNTAWLTGGKRWLDAQLEVIFRHGASEKMAICGTGVLMAINQLAEAIGSIDLTVRDTAFGLKVIEWVTPVGVIYLKTHPLMTRDLSMRNMMIVLEPAQMKYRYVQDTIFIAEHEGFEYKRASELGLDGKEEEFLTEAGLEFHFPKRHGILTGFGQANTVT